MTVEKTTSELIKFQTESPPGNEEACARFIMDYVNDLKIEGCEVEIDRFEPGRANVIARMWPRESKGLLLSGHIDTVPVGDAGLWSVAPFGGEISGDRLYGRGAADMKGGLASMMTALKSAKGSKLRRSLTLVGTAGEEVGDDGLQGLVQRGLVDRDSALYGVVGEPTELRVVRAHKGGTYYEITVKGRSGHASRPDLGVNAVENASAFIVEIVAWRKELAKTLDPDLGPTVLSATVINGGTKNNVIPDSCRFVIDCRRIPAHRTSFLSEGLDDIVRRLRERDPAFEADIRLLLDFDPLSIRRDHEIVRLAEEVTGTTATVAPYGTEAFFYSGIGIPTLVLGPGSIQQAHIVDEFVDLRQLNGAVSIYSELIRKVCL
jgi:succinyl-diaminopimelate desuccinylase